MMTMLIFAIFDSKAGAYLQPWFAMNRAVGMRQFTAWCREPQSDFCRFPMDYSLHEIGEYDPRSGKIVGFSECENLGLASQYMEVN